jgi:hypothetical protein
MSTFRSPFVTLFLALTAPLAAQGGPLIGFGADPAGAQPALMRQALCNPTGVVCTNVLPAPVAAHAGGAAFDPRRESVWHSEGTRLFEVAPDGCVQGCARPADLALGPNSLVGGLTFDTTAGLLIQVESIGGQGAIVSYEFPAGQVCPQRQSSCVFPLSSADHHVGAVALDARRDLLYVAASDFTRNGPFNRIMVFDRNVPGCQVLCMQLAQNCGRSVLQAIRAMAYDECADRLYVSDGRQTVVFAVRRAGAGCPSFAPESCCPTAAPNGQLWAGFDLLPISPRRLGEGCLPRRSCPTCPTPPALTTFGAPVVGNAAFQFRIADAPTGSNAFVIVSPGPCNPLPFGCGTVFPSLPTLVLGPTAVLGAGTCDGGARFPLPIPANFGLCDLLLCAQGILVCPAGGLGLTNAQVVPIGA